MVVIGAAVVVALIVLGFIIGYGQGHTDGTNKK
jgi:hypothetical protein